MDPLLSVHRVCKRFATVTAVDDISLEVRTGEIFALLGPNGAGKTTLLRMLLDLIRPDSGTVRFHGSSGTARGIDAREIGYLPEDRGLYQDVTVLRTLGYFGVLRGLDRRAAEASAMEWLERMQLGDRAREPLKSLSKGNQQKVQFISAILHRPRFAVLDEPFSGLDPLNQDLFLTLIRELRDSGTTVLLSAHQMQLVERVADRILVMDRGREILHGSLQDVRRRWTTGRRLRIRIAGDPSASFVGSLGERVIVHAREPDLIELILDDGEPLGPVLARIGAQLDIKDIETHTITLHDVYVAAVARNNLDAEGQSP